MSWSRSPITVRQRSSSEILLSRNARNWSIHVCSTQVQSTLTFPEITQSALNVSMLLNFIHLLRFLQQFITLSFISFVRLLLLIMWATLGLFIYLFNKRVMCLLNAPIEKYNRIYAYIWHSIHRVGHNQVSSPMWLIQKTLPLLSEALICPH